MIFWVDWEAVYSRRPMWPNSFLHLFIKHAQYSTWLLQAPSICAVQKDARLSPCREGINRGTVRWSCMSLNRQVLGQWIMHPILNKLVWAPRFRNEPIHCRTVPCEAGRLSCVRYFAHCLVNEIWANGCSNLICYENNRSFSFNWMLWSSVMLVTVTDRAGENLSILYF